MKTYIALMLLFISSSVFAFEENKLKEAVPKEGFGDFAELQKWASNSSFGGGSAIPLQIADKEVYCSDRMFTSGRASSELAFFTKSDDGRIRSFLLVPLQLKDHRIVVEEGQIIVRCYNSAEKNWQVAMKVTSWMLPNSTFNSTSKKEQDADSSAAVPKSTHAGKENKTNQISDATMKSEDNINWKIDGFKSAKTEEKVKQGLPFARDWKTFEWKGNKLLVGLSFPLAFGESYIDVHGYIYNQHFKEWRRFCDVKTRNVGWAEVGLDEKTEELYLLAKANTPMKGKRVFKYSLLLLSDGRAYRPDAEQDKKSHKNTEEPTDQKKSDSKSSE